MNLRPYILGFIACCLGGNLSYAQGSDSSDAASVSSTTSKYSWKKNIITTFFWIGEGSTSYSDTTNAGSSWDTEWKSNYGGMDDPIKRVGFLPGKFAATRNPFYVALPFNDERFPELAKKYVPWYKPPARGQKYTTLCRDRWLEIRNRSGKVCYAQWEDVGPLRYDYASYVFGDERPHEFNGAGLDVSPAVRDFLGLGVLSGPDVTDWRFVEAEDVPYGPWLQYSEQAVMLSKIMQKEKLAAQDFGKSTSNR